MHYAYVDKIWHKFLSNLIYKEGEWLVRLRGQNPCSCLVTQHQKMPQFSHLLLQFHPHGRRNQAVGTNNSAPKLQLEKIIFLLPNISFSPLFESLSPNRIRMEQRVCGFEISCLNVGTQHCEYPLSSQIHRSSCVNTQFF